MPGSQGWTRSREQFPLDTKSAVTLILDYSSSRTMRNKFPSFINIKITLGYLRQHYQWNTHNHACRHSHPHTCTLKLWSVIHQVLIVITYENKICWLSNIVLLFFLVLILASLAKFHPLLYVFKFSC